MPKTNLASMSVDALLKLRDDIGVVLNRKAKELESQLARLGHRISARKERRGSVLKGRKAAIKYRDRSGNTWAGRGAQPLAQILRRYEERGDAMRYLDANGKIGWKASPRFLTMLADAEREAQGDLEDFP
jgi:DNA-binding protein H-NS